MTDFWLGFVSILGAACLSWGLFSLGRLWERERGDLNEDDGYVPPGPDPQRVDMELHAILTRPGIYDQERES